jgi:hypothetical protein
MSITGSLSDFSLQEIFQFLDNGKRTGLLTLRTLPESPTTPSSLRYIWVSQGNLVAAANQLNHNGLVSLISQYQWVSKRVITKLAEFSPPNQPLGLYLKKQGVLQTAQLEHIFQMQVVQELCPLVQANDALFKFDQNVPLPMQEMTGLSVSGVALELMLQKLIWLQKVFKAREQLRERSGLVSAHDTYCCQLSLILDTAFFHSLNFSLFDISSSFAKLSHILELRDRPYDLPKTREVETVCCAKR